MSALDFCATPSRPAFTPPPGACDSHCHVFGPAARFPFAAERKYTPRDAPKETLFALHRHLGFSRRVIVQATCHGADNSALVDALRAEGETSRGVAVVRPDISDGELAALHRAGVRGVRFNFLKRLVDDTPRDSFLEIARRIENLDWHVVVYFEGADLADLEPFLRALPVPVVIDHMGRPDVSEGTGGDGFQRLCCLLETPSFHVKVSCPERLTAAGPPYDDVAPFATMLVAEFPEQVLWGTDWPHPNMTSHMPDDGALADMIPRIAPSPQAQRALLVENPERLYWAAG